jgi:hypothetical protein
VVASTRKLIQLPQKVLLWGYDGQEGKKFSTTNKVAFAVAVLWSCVFVSEDDISLQSQKDLWRVNAKYLDMSGKYVSWGVRSFQKLAEPANLEARHFTGGKAAIANRFVQGEWDAFSAGRLLDDHTMLAAAFGGRDCVLFQAPLKVAGALVSGAQRLATPEVFALRHGLKPDEAPPSAPPAPPMTLDDWRNRPSGWRDKPEYAHRTPVFEIECARIAYLTDATDDVSKVCRHAARVIAPETDISSWVFPNKEMIREFVIKLDLLHMLYQRLLYTMPDIRIARFLSPDSSPQGNRDYLNIKEELMIRVLSSLHTMVQVGAANHGSHDDSSRRKQHGDEECGHPAFGDVGGGPGQHDGLQDANERVS